MWTPPTYYKSKKPDLCRVKGILVNKLDTSYETIKELVKLTCCISLMNENESSELYGEGKLVKKST